MATLEFEWPVCLLAGGVGALLSTEVQSRRWHVNTLSAATVIATAVAVAGLAAMIGFPVQLLGALAAVGALSLGARRRSIALSLATVVAPFSAAVLDGVGSGTITRLGLDTLTLSWAAPIAALVGAGVVAVSAIGSEDRRLAVTSHWMLLSGLAVWLGTTEASLPVRCAAPAIWLAVLAAIVAGGRWRSNVMSSAAGSVIGPVAAALGWCAALAPMLFVAGEHIDAWDVTGDPRQWVLPAALTAGALVMSRLLAADHMPIPSALWSDLVTAGAAGAVVATAIVADVPLEWVALLSLTLWPITTWTTSWSTWRVTTGAHALWAVVAALASDAPNEWVSVLVVVSGVVTLIALVTTPSRVVALGAIPFTVWLTTVIVVDLIGGGVHVGVAIAVAAIACAGSSVLHPTHTNLVVLAGSLGVVNVMVMLETDPAAGSLAVLLLAAQVVVIGGVRDVVWARWAGAIGVVSAMLSLWWTTGVNGWTVTAIAPYGATGVDVAVGAVGIVLIGAGRYVRIGERASSWLAYGPGLSMTTAWLLARQLDQNASWATFCALAIGVVSLVVGGTKLLAAPLVIGTVAVAGTAVVSAGPRLAEAPTWAWIAVGGMTLLVVAGLIERIERPLLPSNERPGQSIAEMFNDRFR
jgi:hypothetical protein